jgi:hypothetical protein
VHRAHQLVQKEGGKPLMQNFSLLDVSRRRARSALASGNFGLGKKTRVLALLMRIRNVTTNQKATNNTRTKTIFANINQPMTRAGNIS